MGKILLYFLIYSFFFTLKDMDIVGRKFKQKSRWVKTQSTIRQMFSKIFHHFVVQKDDKVFCQTKNYEKLRNFIFRCEGL